MNFIFNATGSVHSINTPCMLDRNLFPHSISYTIENHIHSPHSIIHQSSYLVVLPPHVTVLFFILQPRALPLSCYYTILSPFIESKSHCFQISKQATFHVHSTTRHLLQDYRYRRRSIKQTTSVSSLINTLNHLALSMSRYHLRYPLRSHDARLCPLERLRSRRDMHIYTTHTYTIPYISTYFTRNKSHHINQ